MRIPKGTRLTLKLSPMALTTVHGQLWVHPLLASHSVTLLTAPGGSAAAVVVPLATEAEFGRLPKADVATLLRGYWYATEFEPAPAPALPGLADVCAC